MSKCTDILNKYHKLEESQIDEGLFDMFKGKSLVKMLYEVPGSVDRSKDATKLSKYSKDTTSAAKAIKDLANDAKNLGISALSDELDKLSMALLASGSTL